MERDDSVDFVAQAFEARGFCIALPWPLTDTILRKTSSSGISLFVARQTQTLKCPRFPNREACRCDGVYRAVCIMDAFCCLQIIRLNHPPL